MVEQYKFSEKEIDELRKKASDKAKKEAKEKQEKTLFEEFLSIERVKLNDDPTDDDITFTLELAPCQKSYLTIDGVRFWDGHEYTLKRKRFNSIKEMVQNGWRHEASLQGKPYSFFQKEQPLALTKTSVTGYNPQIKTAAGKVNTVKTLQQGESSEATG